MRLRSNPENMRIDFTGSNDSGWRETLTISESENEIIEEMVITKDGFGEIKRDSWQKSK